MSTEEFVNLVDELKCEIARLNDNIERYLESAPWAATGPAS